MNRQKLIFGSAGALSALAILAAAIVALLIHPGCSILNSFVGELSKYPSDYLGSSPALIFNIGLAASGLLMCAFFTGFGLSKGSMLYTVSSFFGILTGVLVAAQGIFTMNNIQLHYIFTTGLFASAFFTGAVYIAASLTSQGIGKSSLPGLLLALASAAVSAVFAVFVQFGNMPYLLGVPYAIRIKFIPFALIEWIALALIFAFSAYLSVRMILSAFSSESENEDSSLDFDLKLKSKKVRDIEF